MTGSELPVWVGGLQKWVTGLTKKTTCDDIVKALLRSEGRPQVELDKESAHYALVERWRKVERPLDSNTKVLKVWKAWAEEQPNVRITLKRSQPSLTPKEVKALRNKRAMTATTSLGAGGCSKSSRHTVHPRKLMQQQAHNKQCSDIDGRITDTMERLMKVIIAQGQTIQAQLQRLQDKDNQIDLFEQQVHVMRVEENGANYLVDSYLGDSSNASKDSGCEAVNTVTADGNSELTIAASLESTSEETRNESKGKEETDTDNNLCELRRCARHYERLLVVSDRLEREENMVSWLSSQIEQMSGNASKQINEEGQVIAEVDLLKERVECLAAQNVANDVEIEENELTIFNVCRSIADKQRYLAHLERDLRQLDLDAARLQMRTSSSLSVHERSTGVIPCKDKDKDGNNDTDSNSDTGLSSLHSSCDESGPGVYVLDTLV